MPLDENLPTFHLTPHAREPHITSLTFTINGSSPQATYTKTRSPDTPGTYSTTLHDAFVPDILYASLVASPEIVQAAASPGGSSPEPKVLLPKEFTLQLFNPDSTVILTHHHSTLRGNYWEFSLPKTSFLAPTASKLDAASAAHQIALTHLPRATFRWRKEGGVLSRAQLTCSLVSTGDLGTGTKKAGGNEPDIPIAMFTGFGDKKGMGGITIYQSNLKRVEVEDPKGLEVVLLLGAMAIGDMWFCPTNVVFNLAAGPAVASASGRRRSSFGVPTIKVPQPETSLQPPHRATPAQPPYRATPAPPPREDYKRKKQQEEERRRRETQLRAEEEQIRRMLAGEEARERQRRDAEVERETQRLRQMYDRERQAAAMQQHRQYRPAPPQRPALGGGGLQPVQEGQKLAGRRSFLGLRIGSDDKGKGKGKDKVKDTGKDKGKEKEKRKKLTKRASVMF